MCPVNSKVADRVVFQIVLPLLDDLVGGDAEIGLCPGSTSISDLVKRRAVDSRYFGQTDRLARFVGQIDAGRRSAAGALCRVIGGLAEKEWLAMATPAIVHGQCLACIDPDTDFGSRDDRRLRRFAQERR